MRITRNGFRGFVLVCSVALAFLTWVIPHASAQDIAPPPTHQWAFKLGMFIPSNGGMMQLSSVPWMSFGFDYCPAIAYSPLNGQVHFDIDYSQHDLHGNTNFVLPLTANLIWTFDMHDKTVRPYAGIGGGIYFINAGYMGGTTQPGLRLTVGLDITDRYFLQGTYDYVSGFSNDIGTGLRADGTTISVGVRF